MSRLAALAVGAAFVVACAAPAMSPDDAVRTTRAALDEAAIAVDGLTHETTTDGLHEIVADSPTGEIVLFVDADSGRFASIDLAEGVDVSQEQLDSLARHQHNPAEERQRTPRSVVAAVVVCLVVFGGLGLARRARLRDEAPVASESVRDA